MVGMLLNSTFCFENEQDPKFHACQGLQRKTTSQKSHNELEHNVFTLLRSDYAIGDAVQNVSTRINEPVYKSLMKPLHFWLSKNEVNRRIYLKQNT